MSLLTSLRALRAVSARDLPPAKVSSRRAGTPRRPARLLGRAPLFLCLARLELVELLEIRLDAGIARIQLARAVERVARLFARLRIAGKSGREVDPGAGELGVDLERGTILRAGFSEPTLNLERVAQVRLERGAVGVELHRALELAGRTNELVLRKQRGAKIRVCACVVVRETHLGFVLLHRLGRA